MALNIPVPKTFMQSFLDTRKQGVAEDLARAQAQQARGKAAQSNMLASLLQQAGGMGGMGGEGGQGGQGGGEGGMPGQQGEGQGGPGLNKALLLSGALGFTVPPPVNGVYHTAFGNFKVGESEQEKRTGEAKKEASAATLKSTAESALGGAGTNASFEALDKLMNHPRYGNIAGTAEGKLINAQPLGLPVGSWLQKNLPSKFSPEDAAIAGQAAAHMGNIVTGVAAKFKGPFKAMVSGIINNMKPNMGDSIEVQRGKINALRELAQFADQINGSIAQDVNNGMDPTAATLKAVKETPFTQIMNQIEAKLPKAKGADIITIIDKNGDEHQIHKSNLPEARRRDPKVRVKQ